MRILKVTKRMDVLGFTVRDSVKMNKKVIKAGTTVILKSSCNFNGCDSETEVVLDRDMTESELDTWAYEQAIEDIQPEGWWEIQGEEEE